MKNDENFQRRMLTTLNRKPKMRLFLILNSSFFLWLLSAISLAVGGSIFSQRQKCQSEAGPLSWRQFMLDDEIRARDAYMRGAVREATTFEEVAVAREKYNSDSFEFRGRSASDLTSIRRQILFSSDPNELYEYISYLVVPQLEFDFLVMLRGPAERRSLETLKEREVDFTKRAAELDYKRLSFVPNCSLGKVFNQLVSGDNYFLTHSFMYLGSPPDDKESHE